MCAFLAKGIFQKSYLWTRGLSRTAILADNPASSQDAVRHLEFREITKDRTKEIPVETSVRYLKSAAFQETYGNQPVWVPYRRNHKGLFPPRKTRRTCIRQGKISCGNPCPICRDEYLVLSEHNIELIKQFICPHTGSILSYSKTGLCQKKHQELLVSVKRAYDFGIISFDVTHRHYDYSEYYPSNSN